MKFECRLEYVYNGTYAARDDGVFKEKQKLIPIVISSTVTIILFVIITLLSFAPIQLRGSFGPIDVDKAYHFVAYFCLALPLPILRPRLTIWVVLGIMTYRWLD